MSEAERVHDYLAQIARLQREYEDLEHRRPTVQSEACNAQLVADRLAREAKEIIARQAEILEIVSKVRRTLEGLHGQRCTIGASLE